MTGPVSAMDSFPPKSRIVVTKQGTTRTIQVEGEWDPEAQQRMSHCSMDSSGIALVVGLARRCACQNVRLVIVPGPTEVQRLFQTCLALPFIGGP